MSINSKKSAVRNQLTMVNNQLANVVNINLISNGNYYIPLLSGSTGAEGVYVNSDLSYNATTNTLMLKNLTVQNPPVCNANASNSYDLINKGFLNKYVGDYTQGWIYDDWLTGDVSGNLKWISTVTNSGTVTSQISEINHAGIVRLNTSNGNNNSSAALSLNTTISYSSSKIKSLRFLARPLVNGDLSGVVVYFGIGNSLASSGNIAAWRYDASGSVSNTNKWECIVNGNIKYKLSNLDTLSPLNDYFVNKWVVFEIEFDSSGKPSFYITLVGTTYRTLVYSEITTAVTTTQMIRPFVYINSVTGSSKQVDVDYVDWLFTNITRG